MRIIRNNLGSVIALGLLIVVLLAGSMQGSTGEQGSISIAVIDVEAVLITHPDMDEVDQLIEQAWLQANQEFQEQAMALSEEQAQQLAMSLQEQTQAYQEQLIGELYMDIEEKVEEFAKTEGYDVVLEDLSVIFGGYDITEDIIAELSN